MLKEILWGTTEEIQADQKLKELNKRNRLSATQKAELPYLKHLSRRLFLRRGATVTGVAAAATTPLGAYLLLGKEQGEKSYYNGPIKDFRGLEYVSESSMGEMTNSLENTGHPVLEKIASGIKALHSTQVRPQEFPDWIDEESFPFAFVQDSTNIFTTTFRISKVSGDNVRYVIPEVGVTEPEEGIDKFLVGIKLGLRDTPLSRDPLQPALLLAKEYLTLLHAIAFNEEFYDITKRLYPNVAILDPSGREITDRSSQKAVGRRLLQNNLIDDANVNWKTLDGFAMLLLGPVLRDLAVSGRIQNYRNIRSIVFAANIVTNSSTEFQTDLRSFIESWRLKTGFTFPAGTGAKSVSEPYFNAVINLEDQIDKAENG